MNALKLRREAAKLTQAQVAKTLGLTQGVISQWESGQSSPRVDKLQPLARLYGCTIDELFEEKSA